MSKLIATVFSILVVLGLDFVLIKPPLVRMQCQKEKDVQAQKFTTDRVLRQVNNIVQNEVNKLSLTNESSIAPDMTELNTQYEEEIKQNTVSLDKHYKECLQK